MSADWSTRMVATLQTTNGGCTASARPRVLLPQHDACACIAAVAHHSHADARGCHEAGDEVSGQKHRGFDWDRGPRDGLEPTPTWLVPTRTILGSAPSLGTEGGASKATGFRSSDTG